MKSTEQAQVPHISQMAPAAHRRKPRFSRDLPEPPAVGGARWVPCSHGRFALVDEADYELVSRHVWSAIFEKSGRVGSVATNCKVGGKWVSVALHRALAAPIPDGMVIDHIDGDPLNNRRSNLRIVSRAENTRNWRRRKLAGRTHSRFVGVTWNAQRAMWQAQLIIDGKFRLLGLFPGGEDGEEMAARTRDDVVRSVHGSEIGTFNFPRPGERSALADEPQIDERVRR